MRALVALETCDKPAFAVRRRLVAQTWARRLPVHFDFQQFTGELLNIPDDYANLCEKTREICRFACAFDYDWLVIVDDDVFVRTDRLEPPHADYAGHVLPKHFEEGTQPYCAGSFYWLSRRAFKILADSPVIAGRDSSAEDQWAARNLSRYGILPLDLPGVALEPCDCGECVPDVTPDDWTAYTFWKKFSVQGFNELEDRYAPTV
jgi:hypothetical protein